MKVAYVASGLVISQAANKVHLSLYNTSNIFTVHVLGGKISQELSVKPFGFLRCFRIFRFTTAHTVGTLVNIRRLDTSLPPIDGGITARKDGVIIGGKEAEALGTGTLSGQSSDYIWDFRWLEEAIVLHQNEGVCVQQDGEAGEGS